MIGKRKNRVGGRFGLTLALANESKRKAHDEWSAKGIWESTTIDSKSDRFDSHHDHIRWMAIASFDHDLIFERVRLSLGRIEQVRSKRTLPFRRTTNRVSGVEWKAPSPCKRLAGRSDHRPIFGLLDSSRTEKFADFAAHSDKWNWNPPETDTSHDGADAIGFSVDLIKAK